jgi:hypothetical protein
MITTPDKVVIVKRTPSCDEQKNISDSNNSVIELREQLGRIRRRALNYVKELEKDISYLNTLKF